MVPAPTTPAELRQLVPTIDDALYAEIILPHEKDAPRRTIETYAFIAEWLHHWHVLGSSAVERAAWAAVKMLADTALAQQTNETAASLHASLILAQWRYLVCTGQRAWYDIVDRVSVEETTTPIVTIVVCDINNLFLSKYAWLRQLRGGNASDASPGPGSSPPAGPAAEAPGPGGSDHQGPAH